MLFIVLTHFCSAIYCYYKKKAFVTINTGPPNVNFYIYYLFDRCLFEDCTDVLHRITKICIFYTSKCKYISFFRFDERSCFLYVNCIIQILTHKNCSGIMISSYQKSKKLIQLKCLQISK